MKNEITLKLKLETSSETVDFEELHSQFREDLLDQDVLSVNTEHLSQDINKLNLGAKGIDPVAASALAVILVPIVLPKFMEFVQAWILRYQNVALTVKVQVGERVIEISSSFNKTMTPEDMKHLAADLIKMIDTE